MYIQAAVPPTPLLFFSLFLFFCSILAPSSPHSALAELTRSIHVFVVASSQTTPQPPVFFFSSSGLLFLAFVAVSVFPPFGPTNLERLQRSPTTPPSTRAPKSLSRVCRRTLARSPASTTKQQQRQHYHRAQDTRNTHRLHCCCTACLYVDGPSSACSSSPAIRIGARVSSKPLSET
ncbi:hypothetical protein GGI43DRAFT_349426 [Trichoderma evansii]